MQYGFPPSDEECEEYPAPDNLILGTRRVIPPNAPGMHEYLDKPASVWAVVRQLNQRITERPVKVHVPGYGQFRLGKEGWAYDA